MCMCMCIKRFSYCTRQVREFGRTPNPHPESAEAAGCDLRKHTPQATSRRPHVVLLCCTKAKVAER
jgi:hypothetical protein